LKEPKNPVSKVSPSQVVRYDELWQAKFEKLSEKVEYERGYFPRAVENEPLSKEDASLFAWCNVQRVQFNHYKKGSPGVNNLMKKERAKKLAGIDFYSDFLYEEIWMKRYGELQEYRKHHGDCMVPLAYIASPNLGRWVRHQRNNYRDFRKGNPRGSKMTTAMTEERAEKLAAIDFCFDLKQEVWMESLPQTPRRLLSTRYLPSYPPLENG
jgi:hypothetical protein